jgi:phosphohistidine phosphatase SixA
MHTPARTIRAFCLRLAVFVAACAAPLAAQQAATVVILVRHAEKDTTPANDPPLTEAGASRARALAASQADAHIDVVIATTTLRTQETARAVAEPRGLAIETIALAARDVHVGAVADAVRRHAGQTVLVVGHSNTVPAIITALGGPKMADLCDDQYSMLFTLVIGVGPPRLVRGTFGASAPPGADNCGNPMR